MYDFDRIIDRRGTYSVKWKGPEGELPMWVADMDFETAPPIKEAILKKASLGVPGYTYIPDEWGEAYIGWWQSRHDIQLKKDWLVYSNGVLASLATAIRRFTERGDKVLLQTPVYNAFFNCIRNNDRRVAENLLVYDREHRTYSIDFDDLEEKLADPDTKMMVVCNPQNPCGRIWTKEELAKIGTLAAKENVMVVSDEIHCDLTAPGKACTAYLAAGEDCMKNAIMLVSPTKCFNIPGIPTSAAVIPDASLRVPFNSAIHTDCCSEPNAFAIEAVLAAFGEGGPWVDSLREYIAENKRTVAAYLESEVPGVSAVPSDATYLLWLDCMDIMEDSRAFGAFLREKAGLYLCEGGMYGESGRQFMRLNTACPRAMLLEGLDRFRKGVELWKARR